MGRRCFVLQQDLSPGAGGVLPPLQRINLARAYVALWNRHAVDELTALRDETVVYQSHLAGSLRGPEAIGSRFREFFRRYPDARWQVPVYRAANNGTVEFDYRVSVVDPASGEQVQRSGTERLSVNAAGRIDRIQVSP
jgi:hypothetical protein